MERRPIPSEERERPERSTTNCFFAVGFLVAVGVAIEVGNEKELDAFVRRKKSGSSDDIHFSPYPFFLSSLL